MNTRNTMSFSYHSKVRSTKSKGVTFLFCSGHGRLVLFSHVWMKPKFLLLILTWQRSSRFNVCMKPLNELFISNNLARFNYILFRKALLLLQRFIYRRVNTYTILYSATIPATLPKNQVKKISAHFIKTKLPSSQIIYSLPTKET